MNYKPIYICITPFFPSPTRWQGAYALDQVKAIQQSSDYEVVVIKPTSLRNKSKSYEIDGIKVYLFPTLQSPSYLFNGIFNGYNGRSLVKAVKDLGINPEHIRFVHTHTGPYAVYGLALRRIAPHIKVFVQHHDLDPFTIRNGKWAHWKPNALYRAKNSLKLINAVDLNICISTPCKDNLLAFPEARPAEVYQSYIDALKPVKYLSKAQPKDVYILYNGVDVSLFKANDNDNDDNNFFRIGCIANFQELKDHITLVKAFEIFVKGAAPHSHPKGKDEVKLSLLGSGETKRMCEEYIKDHGLSEYVEWPSEMSHDKLPEYYRTLDLFVLPSVFEGFGCVYTEAHACGVPFIGVYDQGAAEVIAQEERDKWLIKPHDHEQLAKLIERYYNERDVQILCKDYNIEKLTINFLQYIENYNYADHITKHLGLLP